MVVGKHIHLFMALMFKVDVETTTNDLGETVIQNENDIKVDEVVDVTGLTCPMPIVKLKKGIETIESNGVLELHATDRGILNDLPAWSKSAGHVF